MDLTELELGLFSLLSPSKEVVLEAGLGLWQSVCSHTCSGLWWGFVGSFGRKKIKFRPVLRS